MAKGAPPRPRVLMATAGHVDHGKTALVRALTGVETDRLPEEQRRAISIECGYASLETPAGAVTLIDVPGHTRFIRQMVAGVAGTEAVILVVAADEGVMPQTREHLDICAFIGVEHVIVAISRADLVDPAWLALVDEEIREELAPRPFEVLGPIPCSALTGAGLPALREAIGALTAALSARERAPHGPFGMPIDRLLSLPGHGTIVAGTSLGGTLAVGDTVAILPARHGSDPRTSRVRAIESHGDRLDAASPRQRLALNLPELHPEQIARGAMVFTLGEEQAATVMHGDLQLSAAASRPLDPGQSVLVQIGFLTVSARAYPLEETPIPPGGRAPVELRLDAPAPFMPRLPFVLRGFERLAGSGQTLGGGRLLTAETRPCRRRQRPAAAAYVRAVAARDHAAALSVLLLQAGPRGVARSALSTTLSRALDADAGPALARAEAEGACVTAAGRCLSHEVVTTFTAALLSFLKTWHPDSPAEEGAPRASLAGSLARALGGEAPPEEALDALLTATAATGAITLHPASVAVAGFRPHAPAREEATFALLETILREAGLTPPWRDDLTAAIVEAGGEVTGSAEALVRRGLREGRFVRISPELIYHREPLEVLLRTLSGHFATHPELSVGDFKDLSGTTRKWAMPLLAWLDKEQHTARQGETRTLHPRRRR